MEFNLTELESQRHHFLTIAAALNMGHAASVCLESQGHAIQADIDVYGQFVKKYNITRFDVTDEMKRTWGDEEFTTEQGAYGIAFVLASKEMNVKAIQKSRKKTGIDYWLGEKHGLLFQNKVRLEVSGIRNGSDQQINTRFNTKMRQSGKSDLTEIPALVVIIDFNKPRIKTGLRIVL